MLESPAEIETIAEEWAGPGSKMPIRAIAGWYGGNRTLAEMVGSQLGQLDWCGVPFCGGCPELPYIRTRAGVAGDLHWHIINLARVIVDPAMSEQLRAELSRLLFHEEELRIARFRCASREPGGKDTGLFAEASTTILDDGPPDVGWARDYFVCCWMARGGNAGKITEFRQNLAVRWTSSGGDSAKRFHSAIESLKAWHESLRERWSFVRKDVRAFLLNHKDQEGHGLYVDPPWPEAGDEYRHAFSEADHTHLRNKLADLKHTRVVIRYGDHPLIRELYKSKRWTWIHQESKNQSGNEVRECLILNGPRFEL